MSDYIKIDNSAAQVQDDLRTEGNVKLNTDSRIHYQNIKDKIAFYQHISSNNYDANIVDFLTFYEWQKGTLYTFDNDNKLYLALENYTDTSGNNIPPSDDWRNQNIKIFTPEQYIKEIYAEKENGIIFAEGEYSIKEEEYKRIPDNIPYFDKYGRNIEISNEEPYSGIYKLKCSYGGNQFQFLFLIQEVFGRTNTVYQLLYEFYDYTSKDICVYYRESNRDWTTINIIPSDKYTRQNSHIIQPFSVNGANDLYTKLNNKINDLDNNKENISNKSQNIDDSNDKYPTSSAVKKYVDNLKQKIEYSSVGKKTELGGEIFNDYENNEAKHNYSHAEGEGTIATARASHVCGKFNIEDIEGKYAYILGNGTSNTDRSNAHTIDWEANAWYAKSVKAPTIYTNQVILLSSGNKQFALKVKDDGTLYTEEISN